VLKLSQGNRWRSAAAALGRPGARPRCTGRPATPRGRSAAPRTFSLPEVAQLPTGQLGSKWLNQAQRAARRPGTGSSATKKGAMARSRNQACDHRAPAAAGLADRGGWSLNLQPAVCHRFPAGGAASRTARCAAVGSGQGRSAGARNASDSGPGANEGIFALAPTPLRRAAASPPRPATLLERIQGPSPTPMASAQSIRCRAGRNRFGACGPR